MSRDFGVCETRGERKRPQRRNRRGLWELPGGPKGDRTPNLSIANAALSQLSYGPVGCLRPSRLREDIAAPKIVVRAFYDGASAETVKNAVASPIEDQVNGAEGMVYVPLEDVIRAEIGALFPGQEIRDVAAFRVTRDSELADLVRRLRVHWTAASDSINRPSSSSSFTPGGSGGTQDGHPD